MFKKITFVLTLCMLLSVSTFAADAEWTIMVFLNGDNNLEGAGIKDVNEMEAIGSTDKVNVLVQFDRCEGYDTSNGNWKNTKIFKIKKDNDMSKINSPVVKELGEVDMGSYREAIRFFKWTVAKYPAKRYMFVYWNHGAGWLKEQGEAIVKGISYDDESGNHIDSIGMRKVAQEMYNTLGRKMDIVTFDACLMGMVEVGQQMSDYVQYMVASEETEPGDGWPYTPILNAFTKRPTWATKAFGEVIVNEYMKSYAGSSSWWGPQAVTQGVVDLSKIDGVVKATDQLASLLYRNMEQEKPTVDHAMNYTQKYSYAFYKDLYHFSEKIAAYTKNAKIKAAANNVKKAIDNYVVLAKWQADKMKDSHGVAIYAPKKNEYKSHYTKTEFAKATAWDEMLNKYYHTTVNNVVNNHESDFEEADNAFDNAAEQAAQETDDQLSENIETAINIIGGIINLFKNERLPEEEKYMEIDAKAAELAKIITLDMESGNKETYNTLMEYVSENPELSVVLEKLD